MKRREAGPKRHRGWGQGETLAIGAMVSSSALRKEDHLERQGGPRESIMARLRVASYNQISWRLPLQRGGQPIPWACPLTFPATSKKGTYEISEPILWPLAP